ncbi:hypothetical protein [Nonomuraea sp. NPDC049400]|uniref:hypothetical protein n=1 Tax=Nonomuraea sp. NPDC049400 TaxID=3364352 RepID=UPI00379005A5
MNSQHDPGVAGEIPADHAWYLQLYAAGTTHEEIWRARETSGVNLQDVLQQL